LTEQLNSESAKTSLKTLKEDFPAIPIMALMAAISGNEQVVSCMEQLHGLVLIKSSVVKKNITKKM